jgi:hypothetical protein
MSTKYKPANGIILVQNGTRYTPNNSAKATPFTLFVNNPDFTPPQNGTSYSGDFIAAIAFTLTGGGWFQGYWYWCCPGTNPGPTQEQRFALWEINGSEVGECITAANASGPVAPGWNFIPLENPILLCPTCCYVAQTGVNGNFTYMPNQFGSGNPFDEGLANGPIFAYADVDSVGDTYGAPNDIPQGPFSDSVGNDPRLGLAVTDSDASWFGMDVQISSTKPPGYTGTYRLFPDNLTGLGGVEYEVSQDSEINYVIATEFRITGSVSVEKIWYYSPSGATQLATSVNIWEIGSPATNGTSIYENDSPSWSGTAGTGWIYAEVTGVNLSTGNYKVSVYNDAASPQVWGSKTVNWWTNTTIETSEGQGLMNDGIICGPLYAPPTRLASICNKYGGGGTEPGQSSFYVGPPNDYPNEYVDALYQNYWVDVEVS